MQYSLAKGSGSSGKAAKTQAVPPITESDNAVRVRPAAASWFASTLVHVVLLVLLAFVIPLSPAANQNVLTLRRTVDDQTIGQELLEFETMQAETPPMEADSIEQLIAIDLPLQAIEPQPADPLDADPFVMNAVGAIELGSAADDQLDWAARLPKSLDRDAGGVGTSGDNVAVGNVKANAADSKEEMELGGRAARRIQFSTPQTNYAIDQGLFWLARHQLADGGWGFDHRAGECRGRCANPGNLTGARVAATGLALLPFLGSGHTPEHGEYRQRVAAGINFLIANTGGNGSLWRADGQMYGHGIATLALCECYGMMKQMTANSEKLTSADDGPEVYEAVRATDNLVVAAEPPNSEQRVGRMRRVDAVDIEQLRRAAEAAVEFITSAQAVDGGWRYKPRERGDTSVVGWQIMALKSAADAGLDTNPRTLAAAQAFLNSVQSDLVGDEYYGLVGTRYAYLPGTNRISDATTAIGLACRVYMGTSPQHPAMQTAVRRIIAAGPRGGNMYYNYYANQVVFQHGGAAWESWNQQISESLARLQNHQGHLAGSWYFGGADHGASAGGRLYVTAMACLCLEESFRHLPLFRNPQILRPIEQPEMKVAVETIGQE
jgi:hypothetical protein